ncbi:MMPL family transporter [Aromatoleum toluclasticum]|uniref:efflux RND transporter permease subunit n=1 Tax=Aromatoleum toluclasticum TaxID=92003 RepID=UPI0003624D88|nr:MMPL family transporter [Aromatoleum toluclasticum]MCC4114777.1 MMPL family transporter [Aromatoleum toluclasticum]
MAAVSGGDAQIFPVMANVADFDSKSGGRLEQFVFNNRLKVIFAFVVLSVFLGWHASQLRVNASFERMIPGSHPYIQNFLQNRGELKGLGNSVKVVVENVNGDIFDPEYMRVLQEVHDTLSLLPGVDRPWLKGLWAPVVRWSEVTEDGIEAAAVMPDGFHGTPADMQKLRTNINRGDIVGQLVATDYKSSAIIVPLLDRYADTGKPIDYHELSRDLEEKVRVHETDAVRIHIVGFAKIVGELIAGLWQVMGFFAISALIATVFVFLYTRCVRSTVLLVTIATLGVIWLLGMMQLLGYELDPYSILVPFLIFAIGLSHGAQKMNGIMQDIGRGTHRYVAARYTFRRLFMAGLTALLANVLGFAVLMIIDIPVIRDLAFATSIGVSILILTKLILIPVALSYTGVGREAAQRSVAESTDTLKGRGIGAGVWTFFDSFTQPGRALAAICVAAVIGVGAFVISLQVQIGDLDAGAPELRADSRYNRDNAFVTANYGMSSDQFAVIVKSAEGKCDSYETLLETGRLSWELEHVEGVQGITSFYGLAVRTLAGNNEGSVKWASLYQQPNAIGTAVQRIMSDVPGAFNAKCSVASLVAYLTDHKAATLDRVLKAVEAFAAEHNQAGLQFLPAAGSAGIEAVTNIVVRDANSKMLLVLYAVTALLCYMTFRNWRAVFVAVVPLVITSCLCEAIMVWMGIGIKVSTLPVIALGVGVGVDYALYLLNVQLTCQRAGDSLSQAYRKALMFTGKIVGLVGLTMAAAVVTWVWSPIKFQADMGLLLTFMFLWNMIGALIMIPALSHFLLPTLTAGADRATRETHAVVCQVA